MNCLEEGSQEFPKVSNEGKGLFFIAIGLIVVDLFLRYIDHQS
ncbi:hypothetical protein [Sulfolobus acidocaldarius]|nr:hypothetical protein [Sulfolobus acidocaldarius]